MKHEWSSRTFHSIGVAVHKSWRELPGDRFAFGCEGARVDAIVVPEGRLVDPARAADAPAEVGPSVRVNSCELVQLGDHIAVKLVGESNHAKLIKYVIGLPGYENEGEMFFPEVHLVYVFDGAWIKRLADVTELMRETSLNNLLENESISPDGHIEFGPIPVPRDWLIVGEGRPPLELPKGATISSDVWMGAGYILIRDEQPPHSCAVFQPIASPIGSGSGRADLATSVERRLRALFQVMELQSCMLSQTEFARTEACEYLLRGEGLRRRGFVWRDALGYWWEVVYILHDQDWSWMTKDLAWAGILVNSN